MPVCEEQTYSRFCFFYAIFLYSLYSVQALAVRAFNIAIMMRNYFSLPKWGRWSAGSHSDEPSNHPSAPDVPEIPEIPQVLSSHVSIQILGMLINILSFKTEAY